MANQPKLKLPCNSAANSKVNHSDELTVAETLPGADELSLRITDGTSNSLHFLNKDDARKLFNWLGVWLHT